VEHINEDRVPADDIRAIYNKIKDGTIVSAVESAVGGLVV